MLSSLLALSLFTSTARADWKLDSSTAISGTTDREEIGLELNTAVAATPFSRGPQLELSQSLALVGLQGTHRIGLGLRQELTPGLAVSGRAVVVMPIYGPDRSPGLRPETPPARAMTKPGPRDNLWLRRG